PAIYLSFLLPPPTTSVIYTLSLHDALPISLPTIANLSTTYFINLKLTDSSSNVVSRNFYWYSTTPDAVKNACKWYYCGASKSAKDRKSTRLNSSHRTISYAVFCLKKKNKNI